MIGENIRKYRKQKGLTQKELANMLDVTTITVQNYENNRRQPNINTLNKIADILECSIEDLVNTKVETSIGEKIEKYRKEKSMSKSELARQVGISPAYITKMESKVKNNPSLEVLIKIASALDVPITEFYNGTVDKSLLNTKKPLKTPLSEYSTDELLEEIKRRCKDCRQEVK